MNYVASKLRNTGSFLVLGLGFMCAQAQEGNNLLSNGSFESTDGKVKKPGAIESALGWTSPTGMKADLFTPSKVVEINVPDNIYGKEQAKDGENYAGFISYAPGNDNKLKRSYIMAKLDVPLKKGMRYCVKFNVSLAEASKYATNQIGANISKKPFATEEKVMIKDVAHILPQDNGNKRVNQMFSWQQICGTFTADGGEKFLTIGNFSADADTKSETNKKLKDSKVAQLPIAYYYVDDVSIVLLNPNEMCDCVVPEPRNEYSTTIYQKTIQLNDKMTATEKVEAQMVFFAFGKTNFSNEGNAAMNAIVEALKADSTMRLEIQGHSDPMEDKVGAEKPQYAGMANNRVNAVYNYLKEKGINESRLIAAPQGSSVPNTEIFETDDEDLKMAKNRRVTFKVRK